MEQSLVRASQFILLCKYLKSLHTVPNHVSLTTTSTRVNTRKEEKRKRQKMTKTMRLMLKSVHNGIQKKNWKLWFIIVLRRGTTAVKHIVVPQSTSSAPREEYCWLVDYQTVFLLHFHEVTGRTRSPNIIFLNNISWGGLRKPRNPLIVSLHEGSRGDSIGWYVDIVVQGSGTK